MMLSHLTLRKICQEVAYLFCYFFDIEICLCGYGPFFFIVGRMWEIGDFKETEQLAFDVDQCLAAFIYPDERRLVEIHRFISPS